MGSSLERKLLAVSTVVLAAILSNAMAYERISDADVAGKVLTKKFKLTETECWMACTTYKKVPSCQTAVYTTTARTCQLKAESSSGAESTRRTVGMVVLHAPDNSTVPAPKVTVPKVTTPKVPAPKVTTPKVTTPKVTGPQVTAPKVTGPKVTGPQVTDIDYLQYCRFGQVYEIIENITESCGEACNVGKTMTVDNEQECVDACAVTQDCLCPLFNQVNGECSLKNVVCPDPKLKLVSKDSSGVHAIYQCLVFCEGEEETGLLTGDDTAFVTPPDLGVLTGQSAELCTGRCVFHTSCYAGVYREAKKTCSLYEDDTDLTKKVELGATVLEVRGCKPPRSPLFFVASSPQPLSPAVAPRKCTGDCVATYDKCATKPLGDIAACCSPDDHCVVKNMYTSLCWPRSRSKRAGWNGSVL